MSFVEKVCVLGAGSTKYGKLADSIADITTQSSVSAIESAGIDPKEIKASYISNVFGVADKQVHIGPVLMSRLGISDKPSLTIESACGSGSVSFREAYANVAAGFYDCLLDLIHHYHDFLLQHLQSLLQLHQTLSNKLLPLMQTILEMMHLLGLHKRNQNNMQSKLLSIQFQYELLFQHQFPKDNHKIRLLH